MKVVSELDYSGDYGNKGFMTDNRPIKRKKLYETHTSFFQYLSMSVLMP